MLRPAVVEQGGEQVPETPYMDVLVDILLSILVKPSNLLRDVAKHVGRLHTHTYSIHIIMLDMCHAGRCSLPSVPS